MSGPVETGQQQNVGQSQMPRYKCHKEVHALKIASIHVNQDGSGLISPELTGFAPFPVDVAYMAKHDPRAGGYYVVYEEGYKSFSPADVFEKGYTPI